MLVPRPSRKWEERGKPGDEVLPKLLIMHLALLMCIVYYSHTSFPAAMKNSSSKPMTSTAWTPTHN